jgi:hypothetical protein
MEQPVAVEFWLSQRQILKDVRVTPPPGQELGREGQLRMQLPQAQNWDIDVVLTAAGFDFLPGSPNQATLSLADSEEESAPVKFSIVSRPGTVGRRALRASLYRAGVYLGRVTRDITVAPEQPVRGNAPAPAERTPLFGSLDAGNSLAQRPAGSGDALAERSFPVRPARRDTGVESAEPSRSRVAASPIKVPDLTINVEHDDPSRLGEGWLTVSSPYFRGTVRERFNFTEEHENWLENRTRELSRLAGSQLDSSSVPVAELESRRLQVQGFGQELYRMFAPKVFKEALDRIASTPKISLKSLQIHTNNPRVPWELMLPGSVGGSPMGFLGIELRVARWPVDSIGRMPVIPIQKVEFSDLVVIAPRYGGGSELPAQAHELGFLSTLRGFKRRPGTYEEVIRVAKAPPVGIFHFAGHGSVSGSSPAERAFVLRLEDRNLNSVEWRGATSQSEGRPALYFFNACDVGTAESVARVVSGWAPAILDTGAAGYIGGLWTLRDEAAARFAQTFYRSLGMSGQGEKTTRSVAEAIRTSRALFFDTGDPTYLAYVLYGDVDLELQAP